MSKYLYKFNIDYGRMGELSGLFVADSKDWADMMGETVYFGEALGKHSDVEEKMTADMFKVVNIDEDAFNILVKELGDTLSGINPVELFLEQREEFNE